MLKRPPGSRPAVCRCCCGPPSDATARHRQPGRTAKERHERQGRDPEGRYRHDVCSSGPVGERARVPQRGMNQGTGVRRTAPRSRPRGGRLPPLFQFVDEHVGHLPSAGVDPPHRQAQFPLPALDGTHASAEVRSDFLPAVEPEPFGRGEVLRVGHGCHSQPSSAESSVRLCDAPAAYLGWRRTSKGCRAGQNPTVQPSLRTALTACNLRVAGAWGIHARRSAPGLRLIRGNHDTVAECAASTTFSAGRAAMGRHVTTEYSTKPSTRLIDGL